MTTRSFPRPPLAILAAAGLLSTTAAADTLHIPGDHATIQQAIDAAAPGDTLLVAPGSYEGFTLGKPLTIRAQSTAHPKPDITSPIEVLTSLASGAVLESLDIDGGGTGAGPGLAIESATITVRHCTIQNWRGSATAGGVLLMNSDSRFIDCSITGNAFGAEALVQPGTGGGGLAAYGGAPRLIRCTIDSNTTVAGQAITHAATHAGGDGAGLYFRESAPMLINCAIIDNHTGDGGSDTGCDQFFRSGAGTDGGRGGGIAIENSTATLINCLIARNSTGAGGAGGECPPQPGGAGGNGAGVAISGGSARFINCTITANTAGIRGEGPGGAGAHGAGGGIFAANASVIINNSILWDNSATGANESRAQLSSTSAPQLAASCMMGLPGGFDERGNFAIEPAFIDPAAGDFRLAPNSPCIDAGDTSRTPPWVTTDLGGEPRFARDPQSPGLGAIAPNNGDDIVDIGAYEFQGASCYADCDGNPAGARLTVDDFLCFVNRFAAADPRANCDGSTTAPVLNIDDFHCFLSRYAAGCP